MFGGRTEQVEPEAVVLKIQVKSKESFIAGHSLQTQLSSHSPLFLLSLNKLHSRRRKREIIPVFL
jgi:hypothetical protein